MNEVHIWSISLAEPTTASTFANLLQADEAASAARFHFARDAWRYTVGRATLRLILSHYTGLSPTTVQFAYNASCL